MLTSQYRTQCYSLLENKHKTNIELPLIVTSLTHIPAL